MNLGQQMGGQVINPMFHADRAPQRHVEAYQQVLDPQPPLLGILNIITKSRLSFLILVTVPKMPNLSLIPLKPSCHP